MYYWVAVEEDYSIHSVAGYKSYYDAECALCDFLDNTDLNIMLWIVKEV